MGAFFAHSLVAHSGGVAVGECASSLHFVSKGANRPCVTNTYHTIKVGEKQPTTPLIFCKAHKRAVLPHTVNKTSPFVHWRGKEARHAAELPEECGPDDRG